MIFELVLGGYLMVQSSWSPHDHVIQSLFCLWWYFSVLISTVLAYYILLVFFEMFAFRGITEMFIVSCFITFFPALWQKYDIVQTRNSWVQIRRLYDWPEVLIPEYDLHFTHSFGLRWFLCLTRRGCYFTELFSNIHQCYQITTQSNPLVQHLKAMFDNQKQDTE